MRKPQKVYLIIIGAIIICLIGLIVVYKLNKVKPRIYTIQDEKNEIFSSLAFIERTKEGDLYEYQYGLEEPIIINKEKNIVFYTCTWRSLIIYDDGSIYVDETGGFDGENIANIPGAVSGSLGENQIAIVTKDSRCYLLGHENSDNSEYSILGTDNAEVLIDVKEVVCGDGYTAILKNTGEVYRTGWFADTKLKQFEKINFKKQIVNIAGSNNFLCFLDCDGTVYEMAINYSANYFIPFGRIEGLDDIDKISVSNLSLIALKKDGSVFYYGSNLLHNKPSELLEPYLLDMNGTVDDAYCSYDYIYYIKGNKLFCMPMNQKNKLFQNIDSFLESLDRRKA